MALLRSQLLMYEHENSSWHLFLLYIPHPKHLQILSISTEDLSRILPFVHPAPLSCPHSSSPNQLSQLLFWPPSNPSSGLQPQWLYHPLAQKLLEALNCPWNSGQTLLLALQDNPLSWFISYCPSSCPGTWTFFYFLQGDKPFSPSGSSHMLLFII